MPAIRKCGRLALASLAVVAGLAAISPGHAADDDRPLASRHLIDPGLLVALSDGLAPPQSEALDPAVAPEERFIPGPSGAPDVRILIYRPRDRSGAMPAVLYLHGGGYTGGSADHYGDFGYDWEENVGCVVVSVEYRLAPGARFPDSLEDNYTALKWLFDNAAHLNVDPHRIAVAGPSAGGGHAAALAIAARDRGEVSIAFQMLIYPMLDDRTGSTVDAGPWVGEVIWTAEQNRRGWEAVLGMPAGSPDVPAGVVPARVVDLSGLPPTYIGVGSLDLFGEENIAYARRLLRAGVPVELDVIPGAYHGFDIMARNAPISQRFLAKQADVLKRAFEAARPQPSVNEGASPE